MVMITDDEQNMDSALWTYSRLKKWETLPTYEEDEDHLNSPEDERSLEYELNNILEIVWLASSSFDSAWSIYAAELLITYGGPSIRATIYLGHREATDITSSSLGSSVTISRPALINLRDYLTEVADSMGGSKMSVEGPSW